MRLRKPCEHGRYDGHVHRAQGIWMACPGGEFLAEFDLVKEASNDELIAELERRGVVGFVEWAGETP